MGLAARPQTIGGTTYDGVVYAHGLAREFRAFGWRRGTPDTWTPLGAGPVYVPGDITMSRAYVRRQGTSAVIGDSGGSVVLDLTVPGAPVPVTPFVGTVAGPAVLQGVDLAGLGKAGQTDGPNVAVAAAGGLEGTVPFTTCVASKYGGAGFVADGATYYASCGASGIMMFAVADPVAVPAVKRFDGISAKALATDGATTWVATHDALTRRVYRIDERTNAAGATPTMPSTYATVTEDVYGMVLTAGSSSCWTGAAPTQTTSRSTTCRIVGVGAARVRRRLWRAAAGGHRDRR